MITAETVRNDHSANDEPDVVVEAGEANGNAVE